MISSDPYNINPNKCDLAALHKAQIERLKHKKAMIEPALGAFWRSVYIGFRYFHKSLDYSCKLVERGLYQLAYDK